MIELTSKLPVAKSDRLTGHNFVIDENSNFSNMYHERVLHMLDCLECGSSNSKRNRLGCVCNIDCLSRSSSMLLCKKCVLANRSREQKLADTELDLESECIIDDVDKSIISDKYLFTKYTCYID